MEFYYLFISFPLQCFLSHFNILLFELHFIHLFLYLFILILFLIKILFNFICLFTAIVFNYYFSLTSSVPSFFNENGVSSVLLLCLLLESQFYVFVYVFKWVCVLYVDCKGGWEGWEGGLYFSLYLFCFVLFYFFTFHYF